MDAGEFYRLLQSHYAPEFPDTWSYICRQSTETRAAWAAKFGDIERRDLLSALALLGDGTEELPAYERERFAVIVLRLCRRQHSERMRREAMAANRQAATERHQQRQQRGQHGIDELPSLRYAGLSGAFRQIVAAVEAKRLAGGTDEEIEAERVYITTRLADQIRSGEI